MQPEFDSKQLEEVFRDLKKTSELRKVAAAAYGGLDLKSDISRKQSQFTPLNFRYKRRKEREGFSPDIWVRTGKTSEALSQFSNIRGDKSTERVGGLVFRFRSKNSYVETDTMARNKRKAKDAFYATNYRRKLFIWDSSRIQAAMKNLVDQFEKQMIEVVGRKMQ